VCVCIFFSIAVRERGQWGSDDREGKEEWVCVYCLEEDDRANDCERAGTLNLVK